jgi:hypothetical protein
MNEQIKEIIKTTGTDVSGKWMSIDNIEKFTNLLLNDVVATIQQAPNTCAYTTFDLSVVKCTIASTVKTLKEHYGITHENRF